MKIRTVRRILTIALFLMLTGCSSSNGNAPAESADSSSQSTSAAANSNVSAQENPGNEQWDTYLMFVKAKENTVDGMYNVYFPDSTGKFVDDSGKLCVDEVYSANSGTVLNLGFAYVRDVITDELTRIYSPDLHVTAPQSIGGHEVLCASMSFTGFDGLYTNSVTLLGEYTLIADVSQAADLDGNPIDGAGLVLTFTDTDGLPSAAPDKDKDTFTMSVSPDDEGYDKVKQAFDSGSQVKIKADQVTISCLPFAGELNTAVTAKSVTVL